MRKTSIAYSIHAALFSLLVAAQASGASRELTPAENAALQNYVTSVNAVLDHLRGAEWDEKIDYEIDSSVGANVHPAVPFDIDELTQRTYTTRRDSPRFQNMILPLVQQRMAGTLKVMPDLMHVVVDAHFNVPNVPIGSAPDANRDLKLPGVALAYAVRADKPEAEVSYVLLFGNWQNANWDPSLQALHFHFTHQKGTPFIENIVIRIRGADDRIAELLRKTSWSEINAGLKQ